VAVAHDSLAVDVDVVREAFRRFGGHLVEVTPDSRTRFDGTPTDALVDVIRAACALATVNIDIAIAGGRTAVGPGRSPNDAQALTEAVITALLELDVHPQKFVALSYPTSQLDERHVALLWSLLVHQVPPFFDGRVETFVPIVDGAVDVSTYCTPSPPTSLRYAIRDQAFHRRNADSSAMTAQVARLASRADRPLVLFLGAGASASARIPQGNVVRDAALEDLLGQPVDPETTPQVFYRWLKDQDRLLPDEDDITLEQFTRSLTLERVLREEFHGLEVENRPRSESQTVRTLQRDCDEGTLYTPEARQGLRAILAAHPCPIVVTVNIDRQVEHDLLVDHAVYCRPGEFAAAKDHITEYIGGDHSKGVPILKIHGTSEDPDSMVVDLDQTLLGLDPAIQAALDAIFEDGMVDWLWIGCSLRDRDVTRYMETKDGSSDLFELWIDPLPGPGIDVFIDRCRRQSAAEMHSVRRDQRVVSETADAFLKRLADALPTP
jgi:hypothetical protein